jgi:integrase
VATYDAITRAHLLPAFGPPRIEDITSDTSRHGFGRSTGRSARGSRPWPCCTTSSCARKVWRLPSNPVDDVEKPSQRQSREIEVFSPDEISALVQAAASEQDAAIFLTAAFTGLRRGEIVALRWRDVDFEGSAIRVRASYAMGVAGPPFISSEAEPPQSPAPA